MRLFEDCDDGNPLTMSDATSLAEALLGLEGFRVLEVAEGVAEMALMVETMPDVVGCEGCGARAQAQDRTAIDRDLSSFGCPARRGGSCVGGAPDAWVRFNSGAVPLSTSSDWPEPVLSSAFRRGRGDPLPHAERRDWSVLGRQIAGA